MKLPVKTERGKVAGLDTIKIKIDVEVETVTPPAQKGVNIDELEVQRFNRFLKNKLGIDKWKNDIKDVLSLVQKTEPNQAKIIEKLIGLIKDIEEFELLEIEEIGENENESD